MINRINLILRAKNITAKQFAEEIGIQPSGMSHIMGGRNNPSLEFVSKVIRRYPEIDANWLLLGKGEMYTSVPSAPPVSMQSEPTLFSSPVPSPIPEQSPKPEPPLTPAPEPLTEVLDEALTEALPEPDPAPMVEPKEELAPVDDKGRKLVKILFFYDDRTFEEYRPE